MFSIKWDFFLCTSARMYDVHVFGTCLASTNGVHKSNYTIYFVKLNGKIVDACSH